MESVNDPSANQQIVEFAGFRLDARKRQLFDAEGNAISLTSRAFDTLHFLVRHQGETLSKQQLIEAVWPNSIVEENNLSQAISALRKAMGDNQRKHRIILTIPGRGYCLLPKVRAIPESKHELEFVPPAVARAAGTGLSEPESPGTEFSAKESIGIESSPHGAMFRNSRGRTVVWLGLGLVVGVIALAALFFIPDAPMQDTPTRGMTPQATPLPGGSQQDEPTLRADNPMPTGERVPPLPNSIAVLPFDGINAFNDIFAQGLHGEVINQLSEIDNLRVIASASMRRYANTVRDVRDIADELRVEVMLEGNIMMAGDIIRVYLRLFDPRSGQSLWTSSYDANLGDIESLFALKADIALKVARAMGSEIQPQDELLAGRIPTRSQQAYADYVAGNSALGPGRYPEALQHFERAVAADPEFREALIMLSLMHTLMTAVPEDLTHQQHLAAALAFARQALALDPEDGYAHVALAVAQYNGGQWQRAADGFRLARNFGADIDTTTYHALFRMSLGDFVTARNILRSGLQTDPTGLSIRAFLMVVEELLGNRQESLQLYASSDVIYPQWWGDTPGVWLALGRNDLAYLEKSRAEMLDYTLDELLEVFDDRPEALARLRRIHETRYTQLPGILLNAAMFAAWYGENQMALDLLSEGLANNSINLYVIWLPVFDELRRENGFKKLLEDVGMVRFWRDNGWTPVCEPLGNNDFTCNWQAFTTRSQ